MNAVAPAYSYAILVYREGGGGLAVKHGILGLLAAAPRHGYELKAEFDLLSGGLWELNVGQVYSTLERLLKDGLVLREEGDGEGEERKVYRVTPAGLRELHDWLERPPLKVRPLRDEVMIRLGLLLRQSPDSALGLIDSQRRIYHLQLAGLTRQKLGLTRQKLGLAGQGGAPTAGVEQLRRELLLDAAIAHAEADLRWLESCEAKITDFLGHKH